MITRFTSIFLAILLLSGCASYNKSKDERSGSEENINKKYTTKYSEIFVTLDNKEITNFLIDFSKITNQKEALEFLGEPSKKTVVFVEWNPKWPRKLPYECNEVWEWEKPLKLNILFDSKRNFNKQMQLPHFGEIHNQLEIFKDREIFKDKW